MLINLSLLQSYEKVERNAKENSFFFSFPKRTNFGEAKVLAKRKRRKRRATKSRGQNKIN